MGTTTSWGFSFFAFFPPLFAFTASIYFTGLVIYYFSKGDQSLDVAYRTPDVLQIPGRKKVNFIRHF